jgi:uncharacterized membrane protein YkvA (DUF1232 family)
VIIGELQCTASIWGFLLAIGSSLREKARSLKRETMVLYFAVRDPRTPLITKIFAGVVVAYALSPIDLIPDFIPVLGYLDDLVLVPLGIALCLRLIPAAILTEARTRATSEIAKPRNYTAAIIIVVLWLIGFTVFSFWLYRMLFVI